MTTLSHNAQIDLIRNSKKFASRWYMRRYPDVKELGLSAIEHYLLYGAEMGRNPSPKFDTEYYRMANQHAVPKFLNPFVHYLTVGESAGLACKSPEAVSKKISANRIRLVKSNLLDRGLTDQAEIDLRAMLMSPQADLVCLSAFELAINEMRKKQTPSANRALWYLDHATRHNPKLALRRKIAVARVICYYYLGDNPAAERLYHLATEKGDISPDFLLAYANFAKSEVSKVVAINRVLDWFDLPHVALVEGSESAYDRLICPPVLPALADGPLISVLIACYRSESTIETTLRSLQAQTWRNFEAIVIDDASDDNTCKVVKSFAEKDQRIKLISLPRNGGAYLARNIGLDAAKGEFVTIHDADDWSHPLKLQTQVQKLIESPATIATTSQQARMGEDLTFLKWGGAGATIKILKDNVSSFMFRRAEVKDRVGYWDTVRFGADSEKINRVKAAFGENAVVNLETGPMSLQRVSNSSIVSNDFFGMDGFFFGARLEYKEGSSAANEDNVLTPTYSRKTRFPVPIVMRPDRATLSNRYDVIIASDFRMHGGSTRSNIEEMAAQKRAGLKTGIVQMYRYDFDSNLRTKMLPEARQELDAESCVPIVYGETVECDLLIIRYPPVLQHLHRYLPTIKAKKINIIVNQPPRSDYTANSVLRYDIARCAENIRHQFGKNATWYPIGPLVRDVLCEKHADELHHIDMASEDWTNIIDLSGWRREISPRGPQNRLRIGRHSRDNFVKWPGSARDVLSIYPDRSDVEVHIMGGASIPSAMIGYTPKNWIVYPFGAKSAREFLSEIDVFVYYSHPDWIEAFGRTIIEAMAVGVPVILPPVYRPLFAEAALYAAPEDAVDVALALHADPIAYRRQVEIAIKYCETHFSYDSHISRLSNEGVTALKIEV